MAHHKNHEHVNKIKENIDKTNRLSEDEKSDSMKRIEEWELQDRAFGTLVPELTKISDFFEELFSELGIK